MATLLRQSAATTQPGPLTMVDNHGGTFRASGDFAEAAGLGMPPRQDELIDRSSQWIRSTISSPDRLPHLLCCSHTPIEHRFGSRAVPWFAFVVHCVERSMVHGFFPSSSVSLISHWRCGDAHPCSGRDRLPPWYGACRARIPRFKWPIALHRPDCSISADATAVPAVARRRPRRNCLHRYHDADCLHSQAR